MRTYEDVARYIASQPWYDRFCELLCQYQKNPKFRENLLRGIKREHTMLYAFPFKELSKEEREFWINEHQKFFMWYRLKNNNKIRIKGNEHREEEVKGKAKMFAELPKFKNPSKTAMKVKDE